MQAGDRRSMQDIIQVDADFLKTIPLPLAEGDPATALARPDGLVLSQATARALFVHANTVRYRLGRVGDLLGYDPTSPREAHILAIGIALGRLSASEKRFRRTTRGDV